MGLILCLAPFSLVCGFLAAVYDWMSGQGNPMNDLAMSGMVCNVLLLIAFLIAVL